MADRLVMPALAAVGDLVDDIVVRLGGPIGYATDTPAVISRRRGGSAANVVAASASLGWPSRFLGQIGDDAAGRGLVGELAASGVDTSMVRRSGRTGSIVVLVDPTGERTMLSDRGSSPDLSAPDPAWLDGIGVLHVPWYSLADGPIAATATTLIGWARDRRITVSVDASSTAVLDASGFDTVRRRLAELAPDVLFANADEAAWLGIDGPVAGVATVVKRGGSPATAWHADGRSVELGPPALPSGTDTTGAGDAFAAGFLVAWLRHAGEGADADLAGLVAAGHAAAAAMLSPGRG